MRSHLLHAVSVVPKTPEAWALHYVDNLDAKMEMMSVAYATSKHLAARIQEKVWPRPGNLVAPLAHFPRPPAEDGAA